ncbi:MAG: hypothetical protein MUF37_00170 [Methanoregulaceae archaeon]|nr:hypothetical protein [Methanoregulaceae archaeon]
MDSYFATVEQQSNPNLQGRPVGIIKALGRGCVIAASIEAKKFGVKTVATPVPVVTSEETLLFTPTPTTMRPVQTKTPVTTPTKSGAPMAGVIAGLGLAGFLAIRKYKR